MLEAAIYSLPTNSGQTRKAVKETHTQCHADPSLYLFPVKIAISRASEDTRCPGSTHQEEPKEKKGHRVIFQAEEKTQNQFEICEHSWRASAKAVLLPTGIQYPDKTNSKDAKMGNLLIKEMKVQR